MLEKNIIKRENLIICSKNGYIPDDSDNKITGKELIE
jgi:hypothetical protein